MLVDADCRVDVCGSYPAAERRRYRRGAGAGLRRRHSPAHRALGPGTADGPPRRRREGPEQLRRRLRQRRRRGGQRPGDSGRQHARHSRRDDRRARRRADLRRRPARGRGRPLRRATAASPAGCRRCSSASGSGARRSAWSARGASAAPTRACWSKATRWTSCTSTHARIARSRAFVAEYGAFLASRGEPPVTCRRVESLDDLLGSADVVSLHLALDSSTTHLIDAARLDQMKEGAILVNSARGPLIDERALVAHCRRHPAFHAALDVFEHEPRLTPGLAELDNVVAIPHLGSATGWTRRAMATLAAANVTGVLSGWPVWAAEVTPPLRRSATRGAEHRQRRCTSSARVRGAERAGRPGGEDPRLTCRRTACLAIPVRACGRCSTRPWHLCRPPSSCPRSCLRRPAAGPSSSAPARRPRPWHAPSSSTGPVRCRDSS